MENAHPNVSLAPLQEDKPSFLSGLLSAPSPTGTNAKVGGEEVQSDAASAKSSVVTRNSLFDMLLLDARSQSGSKSFKSRTANNEDLETSSAVSRSMSLADHVADENKVLICETSGGFLLLVLDSIKVSLGEIKGNCMVGVYREYKITWTVEAQRGLEQNMLTTVRYSELRKFIFDDLAQKIFRHKAIGSAFKRALHSFPRKSRVFGLLSGSEKSSNASFGLERAEKMQAFLTAVFKTFGNLQRDDAHILSEKDQRIVKSILNFAVQGILKMDPKKTWTSLRTIESIIGT